MRKLSPFALVSTAPALAHLINAQQASPVHPQQNTTAARHNTTTTGRREQSKSTRSEQELWATSPTPPPADPAPAIGAILKQITVNLDGTITRPEVPLVPPSSAAGATVSRDVPLDATLGTYLRLFQPNPAPTAKLPIVLFFHGGGFVLFSSATVFYHAHCEAMAAAVPCLVASLHYRLAPEHRLPGPVAYDDAATALAWLLGGTAQANPWIAAHGDLSRCYVMGNNCGGNMAFFAGLRLRVDSPSFAGAVRGLLLHQPYFGVENLALPEGADRDHEFCNPTKAMAPAALAGLPRCLVTGNRGDPLIDKGREFARWLAEQGGVEVVARTEHEGGHAAELFLPERANELFAAMREFMAAVDGA
ncbi:unnamed protein product [Urochloa decumbens]|uniref:Alpha/beta hydrolase fold-3 domain-containing protein n=1 Tax=Urochloa decumbens TaxID=240449 RepID=A0ABC9GPY6_9POAL